MFSKRERLVKLDPEVLYNFVLESELYRYLMFIEAFLYVLLRFLLKPNWKFERRLWFSRQSVSHQRGKTLFKNLCACRKDSNRSIIIHVAFRARFENWGNFANLPVVGYYSNGERKIYEVSEWFSKTRSNVFQKTWW